MWKAEMKVHRKVKTPDQLDWNDISGTVRSQERAKDQCRAALKNKHLFDGEIEFRIVEIRDTPLVIFEAKPPHGWRLRWTAVRYPALL